MTVAKWFHRGTIRCFMISSINNFLTFYEAFTITFVEQPIFHSLDTCEDKWFDKRNAHINIESIIFPRVK